jgi:dipeptidyl aminopeptidase/acylaminoacyl peptidase
MRLSPTHLLACMSLLAMPAAFAPARTVHAADAPSIEQFLKIRTPGAPRILPDGSLLVIDAPDGIRQLYRRVPNTPAAAGDPAASFKPGECTSTKLTDFPDGLTAYSVSHDGKRVVLMHARGGNENWQLTLLDPYAPAGSNLTPILANPKVQAEVDLWLRDDSGILFTANDASANDFYIYRYDFATKQTTRVLGKEGSWSAADVSKDGTRVLVHHFVSASDVQCFELDTKSGKLTDLSLKPKDGGTSACSFVGYLPDEKSVLMTSDHLGGRQRLFLRELKSGTVKEPLPALAKYDFDGAAFDDTRTMLVTAVNEDGYSSLAMFSVPKFKPMQLPAMEKGVVGLASFRNRMLIWNQSNARTPGLAYATVFPAGGGAPVSKQITWAEDQGVDLGAFQLPELIHYQASVDGREIPAFLFLPTGYVKGSTVPFIVVYHGGPEGQHRPSFSASYQYYLARGYGILMPNVRGSVGYGREYEMLDNYKNRWNSVRDGVDAAEWLVKSGYAVPGHIATYGGSYGGFMSVACIVEDQERVDRGERKERLFGACVDVVGPVNMKTFLEKTSGYRRKLREVEYGPLTDPDFLATISSIHKVDKLQVPFFIAHGFNDPRVPVEEAMQLAVALKDAGRSPRMFIAPDEGHGFAKLDNRIYFGERSAQFLDETIGKTNATGPASASSE